jgi:hypothetical protein
VWVVSDISNNRSALFLGETPAPNAQKHSVTSEKLFAFRTDSNKKNHWKYWGLSHKLERGFKMCAWEQNATSLWNIMLQERGRPVS